MMTASSMRPDPIARTLHGCISVALAGLMGEAGTLALRAIAGEDVDQQRLAKLLHLIALSESPAVNALAEGKLNAKLEAALEQALLLRVELAAGRRKP